MLFILWTLHGFSVPGFQLLENLELPAFQPFPAKASHPFFSTQSFPFSCGDATGWPLSAKRQATDLGDVNTSLYSTPFNGLYRNSNRTGDMILISRTSPMTEK